MGLATLIDDLVSGADRFVTRDGMEGVLLVGTSYREEVYQRFKDAGFAAVFRDGIDNPGRPKNKLYDINLDTYFSMPESQKELAKD